MSLRCRLAELNYRSALLIDVLDAMESQMAREPEPKSMAPSRALVEGRMEMFNLVADMIRSTNEAYEQLCELVPESAPPLSGAPRKAA